MDCEINFNLEFIDTGFDIVDEKIPNKCFDYVFVDLQGFKGRHNRFICKEFCLIDGSNIVHEMIQPPYPLNRLPSHLRQQIYWLTLYYHGLNYDVGDVHIVELKGKVFSQLQNKKIYVKGCEKVRWLEYMFRDCGRINCINIEDLNIDDHDHICRDIDTSCDFHSWIKEGSLAVCARHNALMLQKKFEIYNKNIH